MRRPAALVLASVLLLFGTGSVPASAAPSGDSGEGAPTQREPRTFVDVLASNKFRSEILWLGNTTISQGWEREDGTYEYRPSNNISREAMAAFMYRLAELERHPSVADYSAPSTPIFSDVRPDHTFYTEISWLSEQKITTGYKDGTFRPTNRISREAIAAFMYRYAELTGSLGSTKDPSSPIFRDVGSNHTFAGEVNWMATNGITTGYSRPHGCYDYRPRGKATREAMAAFLYRLIEGGVTPIKPDCNPPPTRPTKQAMFTYGTLMKGQPAAHHLNGTYHSYATSTLTGADLYYSASRAYPYAVLGGKNKISGELYNLKDSTANATISRIDAYERYNPNEADTGQAYVRKELTIKQGYKAWVYVAGPQQAAWLKSNGTRIPSGDWLRK